MQNPNEDTVWNDVLRQKGIIPPKEKEVSETDIIDMMESTINKKTQEKCLENLSLHELDEKEDDIDEEEEKIFEAYRRQRIAEMKAAQMKARFGEVMEISRSDYVREVNKAGDGIWVVLHVYKSSIPLCNLINHHLTNLSRKFPQTKFIRSESSVCIPNYPDKNLPTVFLYLESDLKKQFIGPMAFGGMRFSQDEFEWMLSKAGAVETTLESSPKPQVKDILNMAIRNTTTDDSKSND